MNPTQEMDARETALHLVVRLPPGFMFLPDQHHYLNVRSSDVDVVEVPPFDLPDLTFDWYVPVEVTGEGDTSLRLEGQVFFCPVHDPLVCIYATIDEEWPVRVRAGSGGTVDLVHEIEVMEALDTALALRASGTTGTDEG
jgi:hypothetical protein